MAMNGNALGDAVFATLTMGDMSTAEKDALKPELRKTYSAVVAYLVANMGIKTINVSATGVINTPTPPVPVPTDGGAAILTTMIANTAAKSLSQNNAGTGHVE